MTTLREAAQQALEVLESGLLVSHHAQVVTALRAALAQQAEPVQEPAFHGFMSDDGTQVDVCFSPSAPRRDGTYATAYYTAPPQRPTEPVQGPEGMVEFLADLQRSRTKYPKNRRMFDGLMGEIDELRRAYAGDGDIRAEAFDVAVCAFRIATEGDAGGNARLEQAEPVAYTTGHCANHKQKGGCQLHNLQCGWPDCDRKPTTASSQQAEPVEPVAWWKQHHDGSVELNEARTFIAEDAIATGRRPLVFGDAALAQQAEPVAADALTEPKSGDKWRVEWWNESCRMMLPAHAKLDSFVAYKNGTIQFTIKRTAA